MIGKLFGGKDGSGGGGAPSGQPSGGGSRATSAMGATVNAMGNLAEREEQLEKKKALLERKIADETGKAREFARQQKKPQALMCLKKKKMLEQQLERLDALIARVVEQKGMLEEQSMMLAVVAEMAGATHAQKKAMKAAKIEDIDTTLEEIQEMGENMKAVNEALAQHTGLYSSVDEDELGAELDQLEQETLAADLPASLAVPKTPAKAAPAAAKAKAKTAEEEELEALQAELAM